VNVLFRDLLGDGFAIRNLGLAHDAFDAELGAHAIERHLEVQLSMPRNMVWPVSRSVSRCSEGSARTILPSALPNFSCSALTFALTDTLMTGSGKRMRSSTTGSPNRTGYRRFRVGQRHQGDDVARARFFHGIRFLGKHLDHAADFLALAAGRIQHRGALVNTPEYTRMKVSAP